MYLKLNLGALCYKVNICHGFSYFKEPSPDMNIVKEVWWRSGQGTILKISGL